MPNLDVYIHDVNVVMMIPNHEDSSTVASLVDDVQEFCRLTGAKMEDVKYLHVPTLYKTVVYARRTTETRLPPTCVWKKDVFTCLEKSNKPALAENE
jgi:hypothetical protein